MGVILGHGFAGISGFLFAQASGFVDLTMNFGIILLCLTALMVGKLISRIPLSKFGASCRNWSLFYHPTDSVANWTQPDLLQCISSPSSASSSLHRERKKNG